MKIKTNKQREKIYELERDGWAWFDDYPVAQRAIMKKGNQWITVMRGGKVKNGQHPPK